MSTVAGNLLGQAQKSYHDSDTAPHPRVQMAQIARAALNDAGLAAHQLDAIACVDPLSWTYPELEKQVSADIGCNDDITTIWKPAGGTTPQDLLHEITTAMKAGQIETAIIVGAEAMRTRRKAVRAGQEPDWPPRDKTVSPMRGQQPFTSEWEARHGLRLPIQVFPLLENAIRHAKGRSAEEQINIAAGLLHKNARVAGDNPHAWFQDAPTAEDIATVTAGNRMIAYPYTKRMNAIMDVDQAAAIVLVSEEYLENHPTQRQQAVAILGGAGAEEAWNPIQRPSLAECPAMAAALQSTFQRSGLTPADIDAFDFYSCFPAPIQLALEALGLDHNDARPFTLTGGLAYAGGPGNNYVMHALATAVERLRNRPEERILITGVGMANTKHAATLLSHATNIPAEATGSTEYRLPGDSPALDMATETGGTCSVVSYTVEYDRNAEPVNIIYVLDTEDGSRTIANARDPASAAHGLLTNDPIGCLGELSWDEEQQRQFFTLQG